MQQATHYHGHGHSRGHTRLWAAAALWLAGWMLWHRGYLDLARPVLVATILVAGAPVLVHGVVGLLKHRSFGIDALVTVAVVAAPLIGEWVEAGLVMLLFAIGHALEDAVSERSSHSLEALLAATPPRARVLRDEGEVEIAADQLVPGDVFVLRPGDRAPADGLVVAGRSAVDESALTGEAFEVAKEPGSQVFAGSITREGYLEVRVTRSPTQSTLARMIELTRKAQAERAPSERIIDRFARYYTPSILIAAVLVVLIPVLGGLPARPWIYRALGLLLVGCPCALVISTPVAVAAGIAAAARQGILIKAGRYLEELGRLRAMAFDKTGTLTRGVPRLAKVLPAPGRSEEEVLALAGAVEAHSEHPLARAVQVEVRRRGIPIPDTYAFRSFPGLGAECRLDGTKGHGTAEMDGIRVMVGSPRLFAGSRVPEELTRQIEQRQHEGQTVVLVGRGDQVVGALALADTLRSSGQETVSRLHELGFRLTLLTGDHEASARAVATQLGVDEVQAGLLPEHKAEAVRQLRNAYRHVGMVGDGVNDAPALAVASVGMAMGARGSDAALETADVALMGDNLGHVATAVWLGQQALRVIAQNIFLAVGIKALALLLLAFGRLDLWLAVLSDSGTAVLVTLNSMRLLTMGGKRAVVARERANRTTTSATPQVGR